MAGARGDIKAGAAYVELLVKNSAFNKAMQDASQRLQDFGSSVIGVGASIAGIGTVILGSLSAMVISFSETGDSLDEMSARTGFSAAALSELGYAAGLSGASIETIESAIKKMQRSITDAAGGSESAADAIRQIGLSVSELKSLTPEQQFEKITAGLDAIKDPTLKASAAMEILGKSGTMLIPMLGSIKELRQEAKDLGLSPSPESVKAAADIDDALGRLRTGISAVVYEIGSTFAPAALVVIANMSSVVQIVRKFVVENRSLIVTVAKVGIALVAAGTAIVAVGAAIFGLGALLSFASFAMAGLATGVGLVVSVFGLITAAVAAVFSPIGLVVLAIAGVVAAWLRFTDAGKNASTTISTTFGSILTTIRNVAGKISQVIGSIRDALASGDIALAGKIAMVALQLAVTQGMTLVADTIGGIWGNALSTITSQILSGDFSGAWNTVVLGMSAVWESFSSGIVKRFVEASQGVLKAWKSTVDEITNYFLQRAAEGGIAGAALELVSGVDLKAEIERERKLNASLTAAGANGGQSEILTQIEAGTFSGSQTEAIQAQIDAGLDLLQRQSAENKENADEAFAGAIGSGAAVAIQEIDRLQKQLTDLQAEAKTKREAKDAEASDPDAVPGSGSGGAAGRGAVEATFSAAGFIATAQGAGTEAKQQLALTREMIRDAREAEMQRRRDHAEFIKVLHRTRLTFA